MRRDGAATRRSGRELTIERLIINLPDTAFQSFNWWGNGDVRSGVIPTQTGCVNSVSAVGVTKTLGRTASGSTGR